MANEETLDCQSCGNVIKVLTPEEARRVADSPYNFVIYCSICKRDLLKEWIDGGS